MRIAVYEMLKTLASRPDPYFSVTIKDLWTRPHIARQMLAYHLDQETRLASRPIAEIEEIIVWLDRQLKLKNKRICDLGCGPGLYSLRLARRGAIVTGVDFSPVAIAHAETSARTNNRGVEFLLADYTSDELPQGFDVVTLIYYDYCALPPGDRHALLGRIHAMLNPGGQLVMDVLADTAFSEMAEQLSIEERLMGGFWSDSDYVGIHRTWLYTEKMLSLDHYVIVEPDDQWEILNWLQYFSTERLVGELQDADFEIALLAGSLSGSPLAETSHEIAVIAEKRPA